MRAGALAAIGAIAVLVAVSACDGGGQSAGHLPTDTVTATEPSATTTSISVATTTSVPTNPSTASSSAPTTGAASASAASTTTATTSAAVPSTAPTEHTEAGAVAAANAYIRALDQAYTTGEVEPLESLTSPACDCQGIADDLRSAKAAGYHWSGDHISILDPDFGSPVGGDGSVYTTRLLISITALVTTDPSGRPFDDPHQTLGSDVAHPKAYADVTTVWKDGRWLVSRLIMTDAA